MKKKKVKKRFRILVINRGKIVVYQAQVKNLFWRSFFCTSSGELWYDFSPDTEKKYKLNDIENYRLMKGWEKDEIKIEDDFEI